MTCRTHFLHTTMEIDVSGFGKILIHILHLIHLRPFLSVSGVFSDIGSDYEKYMTVFQRSN